MFDIGVNSLKQGEGSVIAANNDTISAFGLEPSRLRRHDFSSFRDVHQILD
jgi:hypothetical protein